MSISPLGLFFLTNRIVADKIIKTAQRFVESKNYKIS